MMTGSSTTADDGLCPGCEQACGVHWVTNTPDTDTWACHQCGTEWIIVGSVDLSGS
jgi:hypothetical protein